MSDDSLKYANYYIMKQIYSKGDKIYSVDMMISYIRNKKPFDVHVKVSDLLYNLTNNTWGDPSKGIRYSPMSIIRDNSKSPKDVERIKKSDLTYPIIISEDSIVIDGLHRLAKSYIEGNEYINAYIFSNKLLEKFLLNSEGDWDKVKHIPIYEIINIYLIKFGPVIKK